jgi:sugar lactone lactonase YvrE
VVELPVSQATASTFAGADGRRLFITTSREGIDAHDQPAAGALFGADVGVRGAALHRFAG